MIFLLQFYVPTAEDMVELGRVIGKLLRSGDIIALVGDLGMGKTTLVRGIGKGLDIDSHITSPTFTLIKEYSGRLPLYHIDVYRLDEPEEILLLGFDELLSGDGVVVVEWADRIHSLLPKDRLEVRLNRHRDIRKVEIESKGTGYEGLLEELIFFAGTGIGQCYQRG